MTQTLVSQRRLLKEGEAAEILNLEIATLRRWRWSGKGPRYIKVGAAVRYHPTDIESFILSGRRSSTSQEMGSQARA